MKLSERISVRSGLASVLRAGAVVLVNQPNLAMTQSLVVQRPLAEAPHAATDATTLPTPPQLESVTEVLEIQLEASWDSKSKKRFQELVVAKATGEISPEEERELDILKLLRRKNEAAADPEQSFRDYQHRKIVGELMTALQKYVKFHQQEDAISQSS